MAPSRYSALAVLVLVASELAQALPYEARDEARHPTPLKFTATRKHRPTPLPPIPPTPSDQSNLGPPQDSISWESSLAPTDNPGDTPSTSDPGLTSSDGGGDLTSPPIILPTPSNQISLYPPSFSVSWDTQPEPTPENPGLPPAVIPSPSNDIGLQPPSYSISWYKRQGDAASTMSIGPGHSLPNQISIQPPQPSVSWGKRQDEGEPTVPAPPQPTPPDVISFQPPEPSISWGKRDAEPQSNSYGFHFPSYSFAWPKPPKHTSAAYISWGKRQYSEDATSTITEVPDPTDISTPDDPSDPQEPGDAFPNPAEPTPSDDFDLSPPTETVIWGDKREAEPEPQTNSWGIVWPSNLPFPKWATPPPSKESPTNGGYLTWAKRDPEAQWISWDVPFPPPHRPTSYGGGWISWGRNAMPEPTAAPKLVERDDAPTCARTTTVTRPVPCPMVMCDVVCPLENAAARRDVVDTILSEPGEHEPAGCPVTVAVPRKCPTCDCPTIKRPTPVPFSTTEIDHTHPPYPSGTCPIKTVTIVPPCVPPFCPKQTETPCDVSRPTPTWEKRKREEAVVEIEKRVVLIETRQPIGTPTAVKDPECTGALTVTVNAGCPAYTCKPHCDPVQIVR